MGTSDVRLVDSRPGLGEGQLVGRVVAVSAEWLEIRLENEFLAGGLTVSDLVAVPTAEGFLIGLVAGLRRTPDSRGGVSVEVMPIGSFLREAGRSGAFRLGASSHPHIDAACHLLEGPTLARFISVLGDDLAVDQRLVLGRYLADRDTEAVADANRLLQRHLAVLGNTGAGKSWTVALLLERAARLGHANVIVFDLHSEYAPLAASGNSGPATIRQLRVAGPADLFGADEDTLHIPYWLLERDELLSLVINENDPHAADQRLCLGDRVQTLKRSTLTEMGAHEAIGTATVDSPIPYRLDHLIEWLERDEVDTIVRHPTGKVDPGPFAGKLRGLISRLQARVADPRYAFIFHPPRETLSTDWLIGTAGKLLAAGPGRRGIKVVDLSEVPATTLPMVAGVLARLVFNVQFWMDPAERTPVCIVCDEAHLYMPSGPPASALYKVALDAFEAIAKEGRKYGVCLAVVSQRPSDVSRTILSQCNNFIVMRLTNDQDQELIRHLVPGALSSVASLLPMLDVGEAVVIGDALLLPVRIKLDRPAVAPASSTLPYWSLWSSKSSNPDAIAAGVRALRDQWRGNE
jgi:hypothetical protein